MILRTGSAGAGKTASVVDDILERKVAAPWGRVWVILPTELQVNAFRERLFSQASAADMPVFFGVQHFTFYELYSQLLDWMCLPQRQVKTSTVYRILRSQVMALSREDQLRYFTPIVDKPGLIELLARFIYELKQAHVNPADFSAFAAQTGRAKDADLALIYAGYQDWIRRKGAADREGAGWLALDNLQENSSWLKAIDLLVVDGFMQFSPLQTRLLHMLADGVQHTIITLTYEDQRAMTAHRAFAKTLTRFSKYGLDWQHQPMPQAPDTARSSALQHLERFFLDPEAHPV
ncbi:MAG: hypothetical protein GYB66_15955, partial [Chloroflexi bacterium]|nr:hypothetical protein [Chloroflexota bacterium]